jgi:hypothetical protein
MPDQPPDALHYEMKFPPEPKREKKTDDPANQSDANTQPSAEPRHSNPEPAEDKPRTDRHSG